jgi:hypothetical protein
LSRNDKRKLIIYLVNVESGCFVTPPKNKITKQTKGARKHVNQGKLVETLTLANN